MPGTGFLEFSDEAELRLVLSRRLRDALLDGLRADGATPYELEEATGLLASTAGELVKALGLVLDGSAVRVKP